MSDGAFWFWIVVFIAVMIVGIRARMGGGSAYYNAAMICPHCQIKGRVHVESVKRKKGISGGKATAALLTGGFSLLAVGLSRKERLTEAHCGNCKSTWYF